MRVEAIAIGENPPEDVNVIVEVPPGGQPIKYELDKEAGTLVVDRFLYTPMSYPGRTRRSLPCHRMRSRNVTIMC
jgi:inorganic pyrophosphatase